MGNNENKCGLNRGLLPVLEPLLADDLYGGDADIVLEAMTDPSRFVRRVVDDLRGLGAALQHRSEAPRFYVYDADDGFSIFDTAEEAEAQAVAFLEEYRGEANLDGWSDDTQELEWGELVVRQRATEVNREPARDGADFDYTCDYELRYTPLERCLPLGKLMEREPRRMDLDTRMNTTFEQRIALGRIKLNKVNPDGAIQDARQRAVSYLRRAADDLARPNGWIRWPDEDSVGETAIDALHRIAHTDNEGFDLATAELTTMVGASFENNLNLWNARVRDKQLVVQSLLLTAYKLDMGIGISK